MTVEDAIKLLGYGTSYEIQGSYSGKVYHKSYVNNANHLLKYIDREVTEAPFYTEMRLRGSAYNKWCIPVVIISMFDYDLCKQR